MTVLTVNNLTKKFNSGWWPFSHSITHTAVKGISFELKKGEILGFLGPNGAGKTTTIQMLLGILTPTSGSITYFDKDFANHRIPLIKKIGYASGYDKLPPRLTVYENLDIIARIYGIHNQERNNRIEQLLIFFGIEHLRNRQMGTLSAGQTTRVLLAKAFIAHPEIVLLDEPTASLDPDVADEVRQFILAQSKERGVSILITSHNMDEVTELCDRVLVLRDGMIIANNSPEQLANSIAKVRVHLTINGVQNTVELDEHAIAPYLSDLAARNIIYTHISIDKPSLEDYFISVAKERKQ